MKTKLNAMMIVMALFLATQAVAAEADKKMAAGSQPAMTKEQQEQMEKWKVLGAPGEGHKAFEPFVGEFNHVARWKESPEGAWTETKGTTSNKMIMDGRFLESTTRGDMMGMPFEGKSISGYDNVRKEYNTVWFDSMNTGLTRSAGSFDVATKSIKETGSMSCPMTGDKDMWFSSVLKPVDADHHVYEMYSKSPDGKEYKSMEITYERKK